MQFLDVLTDRPLLGDGAMGTLLHAKGVPYDQCFEALNLHRPELVRGVHETYIAAGAQVIETNTFGANRDRLESSGADERVAEINHAGARLARMAAAGHDVFVAGSMGPVSNESRRPGGLGDVALRAIFREQAQALIEGGVDLLLLETFTDVRTLRLAYEEARAVADGKPVLTQMAFLERSGTFSGDDPESSLTELWRMGADGVGVNCGRGPKLVYEILEAFAPTTGVPLTAFFNSGSPDLVNGRHMYLKRPEYLAEMAERLVSIGVNLVGGCCGTTPDDIACIAERLRDTKLTRRVAVEPPPRVEVTDDFEPVFRPSFLDQDDAIPSVIAELDPPRGLDYEKVLVGAQRMAEVGVDLVSVAENPLASPRMGNLAMAMLMKQHAGVEPLVHFTCRDRNLIGLQSDIMGAFAMGLRYILCITGDPVPRGGEFGAKGVYDVASFGLVQMVDGLNRGRNAAGASIVRPTRLRIGVAFNSNQKHLHVAVGRLEKKQKLGAQYMLTQPCWDPGRIVEVFEKTAEIPVKRYMGLMPFASEKNCEFLHNEVPGMTVPDEVRARMKGLSGKKGRDMGARICEELIDVIAEHSGRVYLITPFNHFETTARLTEYFQAKKRAQARAEA
ncbi:MAG: bifunctional homocysteine S-methyltransferase/methylenetetrahydrofolate reductase [Planctomycetota bacterium]